MTAPRRRDATATREAILRAGVEAFTRFGYDGVGVRDIAQSAGVTAMLVNRYFGSKEGLFAEVAEVSMTERTVLTGDPATLARDVAAALVRRTQPDADSLDPFLLMLRSAPNPRAAEILRVGIEKHVERHVYDVVPGTRGTERAAIALSLIAGFWLMRKVIGSTALNEADEPALVATLEGLFRVLLDA
ncbi:TetR/AcrR family transcriptional regulator [Amycolatopsis sp. FDAARGOS 1241]|uniref:TetR/AcrR family transcriptional regulator n=1 Tax=Amycolatopsis sp. FDAARGOS 1241 TaxID=2778070 RepID=UPI001951C49C|nr:TetR/AcrR family transcriptional regulator [Amycolatopsis sp. FDAARGOS 1241]QRP44962.1 TetR/AcrR family transcriptional regulator [Amycolatopsis sp. FDAARGOS 1241]